MRFDTVVTGGRVVTPQGVIDADVAILDGRFAGVLPAGFVSADEAGEVVDATGLHVFPGVVEPHAHIGLSGPEEWTTETAAAARGGVTSVVNYVMGSDTYFELVAKEREAADTHSLLDYALHVVPCTQEHLDELDRYVSELGITSFKFFTSFRGEEGAYLGITGTDDGHLLRYMQAVAAHPGAVANVHPENIEVVWKLREQLQAEGAEGLPAWNASRPAYVEAEAAYRCAFYAGIAGATLYAVHTSSAIALEELNRARDHAQAGPPIHIETCTHYLTHTEDSSIGTLGKVNPPLRAQTDCDALWEGILDGTIDTVGSDHAARLRESKEGSIWKVPNGIPGIPCSMTVLLSEGVHKRGLRLERVADLIAANPARIFGLPGKGSITVGNDADLTLVDLDAERTVDGSTWGSRAGFNLYEGWTMKGWPVSTIANGRFVVRDDEVVAEPGTGRFLSRGATAPVV